MVSVPGTSMSSPALVMVKVTSSSEGVKHWPLI
jgi:hypothetical protein